MQISPQDRARLRRYPQSAHVWVGVQRGIPLLTARVNGDHPPGARSINIRDLSGFADRGMTVHFGTAPGGSDVGAAAVERLAGNVLQIAKNSLALRDATWVTVTSTFNVWRMDEPGFAGQFFYPIPVMGPHRAGFTGEPLAFVGLDSYHPEPWNGIAGFAWDFQDGVVIEGDPDSPGSPEFPIRVVYESPGERVVRLQVTDLHGRSATAYRTVLVYDRSGNEAPYYALELGEMTGTAESGWTCQCKVFGTADRTRFPDAALAVVWAEERYGAETISISSIYPWASNIVFVGWIDGASVVCDLDEPSTTFTLVSLDRKFGGLHLPGIPFHEAAAPSGWHEFNEMNLGKIMFHILQFHTNITLLGDVLVYSGNYRVREFETHPGTAAEVFRQLLNPVFGYMSGSRLGTVVFLRDKNTLEPELRSLFGAPVYQFTSRDFMKLDIQEATEASTAQVILNGVDGQNYPVEAVYPPHGPDSYGKISRHSGLVFRNLEQAAALAGQVFAKENRRYQRAVLSLANYRGVLEPAHQDYFAIYLEPDENTRGLDWRSNEGAVGGVAGAEFIADRVTLRFADGYFETSIEGTGSVYGPRGSSRIVPPEPDPNPVPPEPIPYPLPTPRPYPGGPETGRWRSRVYVLTKFHGVYYSDDFTGPGGQMPKWRRVNEGILEGTEHFWWMQPDPFEPARRQYVLVRHSRPGLGYASIVYRREAPGPWQPIAYLKDDNFPAPPSGFDLRQFNWVGRQVRVRRPDGSLYSFVPTSQGIPSITFEKSNPFMLRTDINTRGYVAIPMVVTWYESGWPHGVSVWVYSTDYGRTWRTFDFGVAQANGNTIANVGAFRGTSTYLAGRVLYMTTQTSHWMIGTHDTIYMSPDKGASWYFRYRGHLRGLMMDTTQDTVYRWSCDGNVDAPQLFRSTDYGVTWQPIMPPPAQGGLFFPAGFGAWGDSWSISAQYAISPVFNGGRTRATKIHATGVRSLSDFTQFYFRTMDGGQTWPVRQQVPQTTNDGARFLFPGNGDLGISIVHDAADFLYLMSDDQGGCKLAVSDDGCRTVWNKAGANWNVDNGVDSIPRNSGEIKHILQVWAG